MSLQEENASNIVGLTDMKQRFKAKLQEIDHLEKKLAANNVRNLNKKIKRRDKKVEDATNALLGMNAQVSLLEDGGSPNSVALPTSCA